MVLLHAGGDVEVIDLLARPEGLRLLLELTAESRLRDHDAVDPSLGRSVGNVVRLPTPPNLRLVPRLPGRSPFGPPVLVEDSPASGRPGWIELSPREYEVLDLIVDGLSNQEIADHLFLGVNTIKTYVRTAYRKIRVTRRPQAVRWGLLHGLGRAEAAEPARR